MKTQLRGCYPAVVTPFLGDSSTYDQPIDYGRLDKLLDHLIEGGVQGVVIAGCTGSASVLDQNEQVRLVKYVQEHFGDRTKVIAGDGGNSTMEAMQLAKRMEWEAGVDTHLSISPYVNKPSDDGIIRHYMIVADNIDGELIAYSVPGRTGGKGIMPPVAERLSYHPRIVALKEASGKQERIKETIEMTRNNDFVVLSGDDGLTTFIIEQGGTGVISVAANIVPDKVTALVHKALKGDIEGALKAEGRLSSLYDALFPSDPDANPSPNPVPCHYALNRIGIEVGYPRLPLTEGSTAEREAVDAALKKLKLI